MGLLGGLFKAAVDVVTLPVAIVVDVATIGKAEATDAVTKKLAKDLNEAGDAAAGGPGGFI